MERLAEQMRQLNIDCREASPLSRCGTFRIGGPAELWIQPDSEKSMTEAVRLCRENGIPVTVIGNGSNSLFPDEGIRGAMLNGVLAGYNVVDCKVTLLGGSFHEVDSSEMAFKIAGSMALKEALRKAGTVLTEPIMKVVVVVPDDYLGDVVGDFSSRRGAIKEMEALSGGGQQVTAYVPLANMFGYATDLRSKTQGRGSYVMEPSHYEMVPKNIQDKLISDHNPF